MLRKQPSHIETSLVVDKSPQLPRERVAQILRSPMSVPQRIRDTQPKAVIEKEDFSQKASKIAGYCLTLLNQNETNLVSQALNNLTNDEFKKLLAVWEHSNNIQHRLLRMYFLSMKDWKLKSNKKYVEFVKQQVMHPSAGVSKNLLAALKVKYLFNAGNTSEAVNLLTQTKNPVRHLNLVGLSLNDCDITGIDAAGGNFRDSTFKNVIGSYGIYIKADFQRSTSNTVKWDNSDFTEVDFNDSTLIDVSFASSLFRKAFFQRLNYSYNGDKYKVDFTQTNIDESNFDGASACVTRFLPESFVRSYLDNKLLKPELQPLKDYFEQWGMKHKTLKLFGSNPPIEKYLFAIEFIGLPPEANKYMHIDRVLKSFENLGSGNKLFKDALKQVLDNMAKPSEKSRGYLSLV